MAVFAIKNLSFNYPEQENPALEDINLELGAGEFIVLCGPSGCGKSTFLRQLKPPLAPHGSRRGEILFEGVPLEAVGQREQAAKIGFVLQSPDNQIVTDKVWHELAFGLESLGESTPFIRSRVAEMASFFGIQTWFHKNVAELSGGQKQLLNLASVMTLQPSILLLDEPTSQLDPIAAGEFISVLAKINRELGTSILLSEHRLDEVLPVAHRLLVMEAGRLTADGPPRQVGQQLKDSSSRLFLSMPVPARIYAAVENRASCPFTVQEGRGWLDAVAAERELRPLQEEAAGPGLNGAARLRERQVSGQRAAGQQAARQQAMRQQAAGQQAAGQQAMRQQAAGQQAARQQAAGQQAARQQAAGQQAARQQAAGQQAARQQAMRQQAAMLGPQSKAAPPFAIEMDGVWFRYEKNGDDVLKGLSLQVKPGEFYTIMGGNGTGKTTALSVLSGLRRPYRGQVKLFGKELSQWPKETLFQGNLALLPQNPQTLFVKKTVREDLAEMLPGRKITSEEKAQRIGAVARRCRIEALLERHPYDLSGGEQQRAALAKVLILEPRILLLDEPTKGMDGEFKQVFAAILRELLSCGVTVLMISHDIEFSAQYAGRCAMFFDGSIVSQGAPRDFFAGNSFYTTAANRMARQHLPRAVTVDDVVWALGGCPEPEPPQLESAPPQPPAEPKPQPPAGPELPPAGPESPAPPQPPAEPKPQPPAGPELPPAGPELPPAEPKPQPPAGPELPPAGPELPPAGPPQSPENNDSGPAPQTAAPTNSAVVAPSAAAPPEVVIPPEAAAPPAATPPTTIPAHRLPLRTRLAALMVLAAIPLTLFLGLYFLDDRKYYFISLLILIEALLPFALIFESRKPQARELMVIAVLCALTVAGRAAFFMVPAFKPMAALVIIAAVCFGGETGFLVGAVSAFVSNMFFGQGPWTPWQMFALGAIGFLAGVLFQKGALPVAKLPLCIYGFLSVIFLYGGLMNPASVVIYQSQPTWEMFAAAYALGLPFDLIHAIGTVVFLWFAALPMVEKLERIKIKYGLIR